MALDQTQNFVEVGITGTYTSTDTTISLESGGASEVPDPANGEYNLVWFDALNNAKPSFDPEVEIVRVTGRDTGNDTLTVQRGRENTSAVAHDTGDADYRFLLTPTSKLISDIDSANFETNSLTVANTTISLGGSGTPEADNLGGSNGTSGQFLQTDGNNLTFADVTTFSGDFNDLENVPALGLTDDQRQSLNTLFQATARNQFENNLTQLNYDGGLFTIYIDRNKIASSSDITIFTLSGGDPNGIAELGITGSFDLTTATFQRSINAQDDTSNGLAWNNDGSKLYEIGAGSSKIYEYNVNTAFDITTATFQTSIDTQDTNPTGLAWNNDGTKLYEIGANSEKIYEYNVNTAFDITTATFQKSINTQSANPQGLAWNNDGSKLYEIGLEVDKIYEYNVNTAFDITTATFQTSINAQDAGPAGLAWNNDGTKLYEIGLSGEIYDYNLNTAFDITTATFQTSIDTQDANPQGLAWNNDGTKLYEIGSLSDKIYEYDVGGGFVSNGSLTLISKDLSLNQNGGFNNPPTSAVLSQSADIPTDTEITYTLRDGNGNTATVTQTDVDTVVDISNFTSTTVELEVKLSQSATNDDKTPTSKDVMVHFKE